MEIDIGDLFYSIINTDILKKDEVYRIVGFGWSNYTITIENAYQGFSYTLLSSSGIRLEMDYNQIIKYFIPYDQEFLRRQRNSKIESIINRYEKNNY